MTEDNDPTNFVPEKMKGVGESNLSGVVMSAASKEATAVLIANGTVYTVGGNSHGELGTGISKSVEYNTQLERVTTIRKEDETTENQEELNDVTRIVGKGYNFVAISTKYHYTGNTNPDGTPEYVYDRNRRVYTWGDASSSQLGTGSFMPYADQALILVLSWVKHQHIIQMYR